MATSLYEDIIKKVKALNEQAPPPPLPPAGGGDGSAPPSNGGDVDSPGRDEEEMVSSGQPPVDPQNPIDAVFDYGTAIAKQTVDIETILKAFKSAIQANFGYNISASWPIVERLRNTENQILINVANRLALFISGTIQENHKRAYMKVSKEEIRAYVKEALNARKSSKTVKEVNITQKQLNSIVEKAVHNFMNESPLFDRYRSKVGQTRTGIEQQLLSTELQDMAIDLFEKICQKVGLDAENLTPDAEQFIEAELNQMVAGAQQLGVKLTQIAAVVKTAAGGSPKSEEGQG